MTQLGSLITALTAGAMLCGCLLALPQEGVQKELVKLLCACALVLCVLSPLTRLELPQDWDWERWEALGEDYAREGEKTAAETVSQLIRGRIASYIMDKAQELGLALEVEVTLDEENLPRSVQLSGAAPPEPRQRLEEALARELGIAKEKLEWIG